MRHRYSSGAVVVMTVLLLGAVVAFAFVSLSNGAAAAVAPTVAAQPAGQGPPVCARAA